MAYGKRLQIEYKDINDIDTRIEVHQEGYAGAVTYRDYAGGEIACEQAWGDSGDKRLPTVYGSQCTLYFDAEIDFEFMDFFTSNSRKNKILVYKNNQLKQVTFGEADTWEEPLIAAPYEVVFTGYDGLGLLAEEDFLDANRDYYEGEMTPLAILQLILSKTGLDLPLNTAVSIRPAGALTAEDALTQVLKDVVSYRDMSCFDVLEVLFQGCRIFQRNGEWWCVSHDKWMAASFSAYNYSAAGAFVGMVNIDTTFSGFWFEGEGAIGFMPALKQMTIKQDYGFKPNLIDNGDFTELNNGTFEGWTAVNVVPEQKTFDADGNKYIHLPGSETTGDWENDARTRYLRWRPIRVEQTTSILKASVSYALMGPSGSNGVVMIGLMLVGDNGITYGIESKKYYPPDGSNPIIQHNWYATAKANRAIPVDMGVYKESGWFSGWEREFKRVEAYPHDKVTDHFSTFSMTVEAGIPTGGQLYFYLFLTHDPNGIVAGNCFRKVSLSFADENDDALPTDTELVLINDSGNNFVPDDLELPNGDIPEIPNKLTVYDGGFILNDGSGAATTLWAVDGNANQYTYAELVARYIASDMRVPRQAYKVKPADATPGISLVFEKAGLRLVEAGITYNDRMQTIEGRYVELLALNIAVFTVGEKINYTSPKSGGSSGSAPAVIDTDEMVALANENYEKTSRTGYLSNIDFLAIIDPDSGRSVFKMRYTWAINEIPAGVINGVNKTFELANTPAGGVQLFVYPFTILHPDDFTLNGTTITLAANAVAPADDEQLLASYPYLKLE